MGLAKGKGMDSVLDKNGKIMRGIGRELVCEVTGYWNELHIPLEEICSYGLKKGDVLKLILKSVMQFGEEKGT